MCDRTSSSSGSGSCSGAGSQRKAEIEQITGLSASIGNLLTSHAFSDVTLLVEGERLPVHKVILASRSNYFRALFYCGMKESKETEIELKDTSVAAFRSILGFIYTGRLRLGDLKEEAILDVLGLAHQYEFPALEVSIADYLQSALSVDNVCIVYDASSLYGQTRLAQTCLQFMDVNASQVLRHETFLQLSSDGLQEVLRRDSLFAPEAEIFEGVRKWLSVNEVPDPSVIMAWVRLPLLSVNELLTIVRPTGLISPDELLDAIQARNEGRNTDLKYRGFLVAEENVATYKYGASVTMGEMPDYLLDGETDTYDMERGFTRHGIEETGPWVLPRNVRHKPGLPPTSVGSIAINSQYYASASLAGGSNFGGFGAGLRSSLSLTGEKPCNAIIVRLGQPCILNHLKLLLWDKDSRSYSYYVEGSVDQTTWEVLVDHSSAHCRSWQQLYFTPRVVQYIKVVGTYNTNNRVFHLVALEAYYTAKPFTLRSGVVVPDHNVASSSLRAFVIEGVSRSRDALINGDTRHYDWDSGYTCHQLGGGAIVVQLPQPYWINSMRLLLWDCDDRSYSYHIETSLNNRDWVMAVNKDMELCRSWQNILLEEPRAVVYIKIVGVHNTANEVFHCVHFECPSTEVLESEAARDDSKAANESNDKEPEADNRSGRSSNSENRASVPSSRLSRSSISP